MAVEIKNLTSGNTAAVNTDGEMGAALPRDEAKAGFSALAAETHDGLTGWSTRVVRRGSISPNGYFRTGLDNMLWRDLFNHAIVQNDAYQVTLATMTTAVTGGYWQLNSGSSTASAAVARVQTYRTFEVFGFGTTMAIFRVRVPFAPVSNNVFEVGLGFAATTATPTDGVYFKQPSAGGVLQGVVNFNGVETTVNLATTLSANVVYELRVRIDEDEVNFFVNGLLEGVIGRDTSAPSVAFARHWPMLLRIYNAGVTGSAQRLDVAEVGVFQTDIPSFRTPDDVAGGLLAYSANVTRGVATGQTANWTNSTEPVNATLSNTAAGYTTLGGQWAFAAPAGAVTDFALFGYQVPTGGAALLGKNLVITGVTIDAMNVGAAVATTATVLQWGLGIGSTAVSLATADGTGTRAPRRIPLGMQAFLVGAGIGTQATKIVERFQPKLTIEPGTFIHVIVRVPVGTATASQVVRGTCRIDGYWE